MIYLNEKVVNSSILNKTNAQPRGKNTLHESVIKDNTNGEPLSEKTYRDVLNHLQKKYKRMFRHIKKAGQDFQDIMFVYMSDFMFQEMVPDTYNYTKLFGLWKG